MWFRESIVADFTKKDTPVQTNTGASDLRINDTAIPDTTIIRLVTLEQASLTNTGGGAAEKRLVGVGGTKTLAGGFAIHQFPNVGSQTFTLS